MPITHKWDGTILTITSDSGSSSCDLKGEKGDDGARGAQGAPGGTCYEVTQAAYNLLDNSDFTNPINQRGKTTAAVGSGYFIDRWYCAGNCAASITADGLSATGDNGICQILPEKHIGKTLTLAAFDINGKLHVLTAVITEPTGSAKWLGTYYANNGIFIGILQTSGGYVSVYLHSKSESFIWAALYEGEYTADTLPAYQPKGYAAELAECKRYYQTMIPTGRNPYLSTIAQRGYSILLEQEMRIAPTIILKDCIEYHEGTWGTTNAVFTSQSAAKSNFIVTAESTINSGERPFAFIAYEASADL